MHISWEVAWPPCVFQMHRRSKQRESDILLGKERASIYLKKLLYLEVDVPNRGLQTSNTDSNLPSIP